MPGIKPERTGKSKRPAMVRAFGRPARASAKLSSRRLPADVKPGEASFRLLFDSNPVPMIVCSPDGEKILGVNDAAIHHYG